MQTNIFKRVFGRPICPCISISQGIPTPPNSFLTGQGGSEERRDWLRFGDEPQPDVRVKFFFPGGPKAKPCKAGSFRQILFLLWSHVLVSSHIHCFFPQQNFYLLAIGGGGREFRRFLEEKFRFPPTKISPQPPTYHACMDGHTIQASKTHTKLLTDPPTDSSAETPS